MEPSNPQHQLLLVLAAIISGAAGLLGHPILVALFAVAILDLITGVIKGFLLRRIESHIFSKGVWRLAIYLGVGSLFVLVGRIDDSLLTLTNAIMGLYIGREIISIVENAFVISRLKGLDMPSLDALARTLRLNIDKLEREINGDTPPNPPSSND